MRKKIQLGHIAVKEDGPPLVIAELGINHNGDLNVAKEMVDAALRGGAQCVKHQTHIVEDEMSSLAQTTIPGNSSRSIYDIMADAALSEDDEYELMKYVEAKGMLFLSTPFSRAAADRLHRFGVKGYKIGSGECNNYPLIEHIASFGKPMIVSTGMNSLESIRKTVNIMRKHGVDFALLHTTNLYPTQPHMVRLGAMQLLMKEFPDVLVGLSDHTLNNNACIAATALGAAILERHFTDSMYRVSPDVICSMDTRALAELLQAVKEIALMRGGEKGPLPEEQVTIDFAFATVVTTASVKAGAMFTKDNLWVKRPGTGAVPAEHYPGILGKRAACDIDADTHLDFSMIQ